MLTLISLTVISRTLISLTLILVTLILVTFFIKNSSFFTQHSQIGNSFSTHANGINVTKWNFYTLFHNSIHIVVCGLGPGGSRPHNCRHVQHRGKEQPWLSRTAAVESNSSICFKRLLLTPVSSCCSRQTDPGCRGHSFK